MNRHHDEILWYLNRRLTWQGSYGRLIRYFRIEFSASYLLAYCLMTQRLASFKHGMPVYIMIFELLRIWRIPSLFDKHEIPWRKCCLLVDRLVNISLPGTILIPLEDINVLLCTLQMYFMNMHKLKLEIHTHHLYRNMYDISIAKHINIPKRYQQTNKSKLIIYWTFFLVTDMALQNITNIRCLRLQQTILYPYCSGL